MADKSNPDGATNWYEEPITIVGFVAGFLLLVLVIASFLILCYSKNEDDEEEQNEQTRNRNVNQELRGANFADHDKTNPLYLSANEFDLKPFPSPARANFVHIHVDDAEIKREGFKKYYNTEDSLS